MGVACALRGGKVRFAMRRWDPLRRRARTTVVGTGLAMRRRAIQVLECVIAVAIGTGVTALFSVLGTAHVVGMGVVTAVDFVCAM
jgi:hypothetical protein